VTHFDFFNVIAKRGWLAKLTGVELKVLTCYASHANSDGDTFVSSDTVAELMGLTTSGHVREARKRLVALGLMHPGRREPTRRWYRVAVPTSDCPAEGLCENGTVPDPAKRLSENRTQGVSENGTPRQAIEASHLRVMTMPPQ
jgi:hypothetical protein